jgi:hypothetical protein
MVVHKAIRNLQNGTKHPTLAKRDGAQKAFKQIAGIITYGNPSHLFKEGDKDGKVPKLPEQPASKYICFNYDPLCVTLNLDNWTPPKSIDEKWDPYDQLDIDDLDKPPSKSLFTWSKSPDWNNIWVYKQQVEALVRFGANALPQLNKAREDFKHDFTTKDFRFLRLALTPGHFGYGNSDEKMQETKKFFKDSAAVQKVIKQK